MKERKWYQKTWVIVIIGLIIPPVGFFLALINPHYSMQKNTRELLVALTIGFSIFPFLIGGIIIYDKVSTSNPSYSPAFEKALEEGISDSTDSASDTTTETTEEIPEEPVEPEPTETGINALDDNAATELAKEADTENLYKKEKATLIKDAGVVTIEFETSFWDDNDSVFKTNMAAEQIMPKFFEIEGVKVVRVKLNTQFTDQFGKSSTEKAVVIGLTKATADKINWENILLQNRAGLLNIADDMKYIHPGIYKEVNNEDIIAAYE